MFADGRNPTVSLVIQDRAFALSRALRRLDLSDLYTSTPSGHIGVQLGEYAFSGSGMTSANLGDVVLIGPHAFDSAMQLSEVYSGRPSSQHRHWGVWKLCLLSMVSIPASVLAIGDRAFAGCTRLSAVEFRTSGRFIFSAFGSFVFDQAAEITTVLFQSDLLYLGTDKIPTSTILKFHRLLRTGFVRFPMAISATIPSEIL